MNVEILMLLFSFSMDDEFQETSKALTVAQEELRATQQELHLTLGFHLKHFFYCQFFHICYKLFLLLIHCKRKIENKGRMLKQQLVFMVIFEFIVIRILLSRNLYKV